MTVLVVEPVMDKLTSKQIERFIDDFYEAVDYETATGFETRVILKRFTQNKPVYKPLTCKIWIEGFLNV